MAQRQLWCIKYLTTQYDLFYIEYLPLTSRDELIEKMLVLQTQQELWILQTFSGNANEVQARPAIQGSNF